MTISTKCDKAIGALLSACAAILILITSCDRLTDWKSVSWNHYATGFYLENDLTVKTQNEGVIEITKSVPRGNTWEERQEQFLTVNTLFFLPQKRGQLEQIVQKFGEADHKERVYAGYAKPAPQWSTPDRYFLKTPIDKVELVSDRDWADQPAGSVLNAHFWLLGRCHDRYAKHLDNPGRQKMPADFHIKSEAYMKLVAQAYDRTGEEDWDLRDGLYEVILSPLDRVDFASMDYLEPQLFLTSDSPHFAEPQTLTIRTTFRDGTVTTLTSEINKPK